MNWQSCFEKYKYKSLISEDKNENEKILMEMFYEDGKKPDELQQVYLSEKEDELFIILQMEPDMDAKKLSDKWDAKILAFINFGEDYGTDHAWIEKTLQPVQFRLLCPKQFCHLPHLGDKGRHTFFKHLQPPLR